MTRLDISKLKIDGKLLATGNGVDKMLEVCNENKWDKDNTLLVLADPEDLQSEWKIYGIKGGENE